MNSTVILSVVIPIHNEEGNINELIKRLTQVMLKIGQSYELIFVDDGSTDNSLIKLKEHAEKDGQIVYLCLSRNFGHQNAVTAGLEIASGQNIITMDGDLQDPPELIEELYQKAEEGFDVVYAKRKKRDGETLFKKITAKLFYRIFRLISELDIPLDTGDFRLTKRNVHLELIQMPEKDKFLRGQVAWLGFKQTYVEFQRAERFNGETSYTLGKMIRLATDAILGYSDFPLKMVTLIGLLISGLSSLIIIYALYSHFVLDRTITGWTSLMVSSTFLGGVQLLSIGIIGIYIRRINNNVADRPVYVVRSSNLKFD